MTEYTYRFCDGDFRLEHKLDRLSESERPMHTHDRIEIYYFISGDCHCLVEGTDYLLKPRDILIIRPFEAHIMNWYGTMPYERIVIDFPVSLLCQIDTEGVLLKYLLDRPLGTVNRFTDADFGHTACGDILSDIGDKSTRADIIAVSLLILSEARRISLKRQQPTRAHKLANKIIDYVNSELFSQITAADICQRFFISRSQLNRIFKESTGSSLLQYITAKRMMTARARLQNGESAAVVADECGYSDYSVFYRAYTKYFGVSPKAYKNKNQP